MIIFNCDYFLLLFSFSLCCCCGGDCRHHHSYHHHYHHNFYCYLSSLFIIIIIIVIFIPSGSSLWIIVIIIIVMVVVNIFLSSLSSSLSSIIRACYDCQDCKLNIHLDDSSISASTNFNDIVSGCDLWQLVIGATHIVGYTLDIVITNSSFVVKVNVDLPIFSDQSLLTTVIPLQDVSYVDPSASRIITKHNWKKLEIAAFRRDVLLCDVLTKPIVDCDSFYDTCDWCLWMLVDKHAPLAQNIALRSSAPWYNYHCHLVKATTRWFKKTYHRTRTEEAFRNWCKQSMVQQTVFRRPTPTIGI